MNRLTVWGCAALCAAAAGSAAWAADAPKTEDPEKALEGHYIGKLLAQDGSVSDAEMSFDQYKCFIISVKRDGGFEMGFYALKDGRLTLSDTQRRPYRWFRVGNDGRLIMLASDGKPVDGKDCCELLKD